MIYDTDLELLEQVKCWSPFRKDGRQVTGTRVLAMFGVGLNSPSWGSP
jgi:hypothetical protein